MNETHTQTNNRILLVDDEETLRCALSESLIDKGYNVDVASNGFQAMERFKFNSYDLMITDIKMGGMDGLQLIRELKRNISDLKTIIITAYGSLEMVKEATRLGVLELVSKPFKIQEIKDIITRTLNDDNIQETSNNEIKQSWPRDCKQPRDNLLLPTGLSHYFTGPASQPKSTIVFDSVAISKNRAMLIFGNINSQSEMNREWWENKQIGIMIKTLFRSKAMNTPKKVAESINDFICKNIQPSIDMSMLCALFDKRKNIIKYVNYGNSLVCSVLTQEGQIKTLDSFPYLLGVLPEIEFIEKTLSYSHESRMALASSNTISEIIEKGSFIKDTIEDILHSIKDPRKNQSGETDKAFSFTERKEANFDDETVLLVDLDWNYNTLSKKKYRSNTIGEKK